MTPASPSQPARWKRWLFFGVIGALPVLALALMEFALRIAGFGGYPPFFKEVGPVAGGTLYFTDRAGAASWFFANPDRPGYNEQSHFLMPKPTNTFRVFVAGESATKGYPQPRNLAASAFLEAMLRDAWSDRDVEVINLGITAVASYPVLGVVTEALDFAPDLMIIHTGHNEFFGTYGVASIGRGGKRPWQLALRRMLHSLALVQALDHWTSPGPVADRTLMELMAAQSHIPADDPLREAAARNLAHNLTAMIQRCQQRGVPVLVCTMPSNERDLAPIGDGSPPTGPGTNESAIAHFRRGQALLAAGRAGEARTEFTLARDLDPMPWRAPSAANDAIRQAAAHSGAILCDLEAAFHRASPDGLIGWELMDDHVHPSLSGQALTALAWASALTNRFASDLRRVASGEDYTRRLGDNFYDRYAVAHQMRVLFAVPFLQRNNPAALARFTGKVEQMEAEVSPEIRGVMQEWQSPRPHAGMKRPLTGMVARELMRQRRFAEALEWFQYAQRSVPEYTSLYAEYVYFALACGEKLHGGLDAAQRRQAAEVIAQCQVLMDQGRAESGFPQRHAGRLHQLRGEFAEAIPYLQAARARLAEQELVAADQALMVSYLKLGRFEEAAALAQNGVKHSGQYAEMYRGFLRELEAMQATNAPAMPSHPAAP